MIPLAKGSPCCTCLNCCDCPYPPTRSRRTAAAWRTSSPSAHGVTLRPRGRPGRRLWAGYVTSDAGPIHAGQAWCAPSPWGACPTQRFTSGSPRLRRGPPPRGALCARLRRHRPRPPDAAHTPGDNQGRPQSDRAPFPGSGSPARLPPTPTHHHARAGPSLHLRVRRNYGQPPTLWTWSKVVRAIALRAGLPRFSTHTLRHLCLTDLARAGWDIHEIAAFAGHRHPERPSVHSPLGPRPGSTPGDGNGADSCLAHGPGPFRHGWGTPFAGSLNCWRRNSASRSTGVLLTLGVAVHRGACRLAKPWLPRGAAVGWSHAWRPLDGRQPPPHGGAGGSATRVGTDAWKADT